MTREEAIELLEDLNGAIEDNHGRDYDEAFRMAIEALTLQNLTEPNNTCEVDLISRADAIEAIDDVLERTVSNIHIRGVTKGRLKDAVKALPSADAIHSGGVFVPNMEMPKVCDYCLFHDSEWSWCKAKDKYCGDGKCPLIAVRGERND